MWPQAAAAAPSSWQYLGSDSCLAVNKQPLPTAGVTRVLRACLRAPLPACPPRPACLQHKATHLTIQCRDCRGTKRVACKPGMGGAFLPSYCDLNMVRTYSSCAYCM